MLTYLEGEAWGWEVVGIACCQGSPCDRCVLLLLFFLLLHDALACHCFAYGA